MDKLGKYIIEEPLGEGGMGMVYRALDPVIGRRVAIKVIHQRVMSPAIKDRFYREAQSVGRLSHENITTLFDVGEQDGDPFLVLELLGGTDLRRLLHEGMPLTLAQKLDIAEQICRGLQYAHANDVIHRDIKPDNVRVLEGGRVKIMDFGLARIESDTLTHSSMGTPRYMSPEQIKDAKVDHRTDIFSFGVLFYELLSGTNPFSGDRLSTIVYKILHEEPEPPSIDDELLTDGLQQIVTTCIQKDPDRRYQDFGAVLSALASVRTRPADARTRTRLAPASESADRVADDRHRSPEERTPFYRSYAAAAVVLLALAAGAYLLFPSRVGGPPGEPDLTGTSTAVGTTVPEAGEAGVNTDTGALVAAETLSSTETDVAETAPEFDPEPVATQPEADAAARAAEVERQERRRRADGSRAEMEETRRTSRGRLSRPGNVPGYQEAEAVRARAAQRYRSGEYEMAAQLFQEAQELYDRVEEPEDEEETTPAVTAAPDPSAADQARARMRAAKDEVDPVLTQHSVYQEAAGEERLGNESYASEAYDEAAAYFDRARVRFEEVAELPTPRDEVENALAGLVRNFERSMEAEDAQGLYDLSPFYAKSTWTGFFGVVSDVDADIRYEIVEVEATTASVSVAVRLHYLNNKNERQTNDFAYTWTLTSDAPQSWTLARVQNR